MRNSCGGQGCNTPEHDKRLGYDEISIDIDTDNKIVYFDEGIELSLLLDVMEQIDEDYEEYKMYPRSKFGIRWTTTIAN